MSTLDKIQYIAWIKTSCPQMNDADISMSYEKYIKTGILPKGLEHLAEITTQSEKKTDAIWSKAPIADNSTFGFEKSTANAKTAVMSKSENVNTNLTAEQAKEFTINSLGEAVNKSTAVFMNEVNNEGVVSKGYNSIKELLDSEMSKSAVTRTLYAEQTGVVLMDKANKNELSKQEYHDAKINLLMDILPGSKSRTKAEIKALKDYYNQFPQEKLNTFISAVTSCNDEDYKKLAIRNESLIKNHKPANNITLEGQSRLQFLPKNTPPKIINGEELITFEEVFLNERGKEFKKENVEEYSKQESQLAFVTTVQNKTNQIHHLLDSDITLVKGNNEGAVPPEVANASNKRLEISLKNSLVELYGEDSTKINAALKRLNGSNLANYENGEIKFSQFAQGTKSYSLVNISEKLLAETDANCKRALGDKKLSEYQQQYADSYINAYGLKNSKDLSSAYIADQEGAVQKVKTGVQVGGMIVAIGGALVPGPGWVASAGILTSTFGGTAVGALNEGTRANGMSAEAKQALIKEVGTNVAFLGVGMASGGLGTAAKMSLLEQNCPKLIAYAADYGTQAASCLLGDLAINGEIDLKSESIGQSINLISGIILHNRIGKMGAETSTYKINPDKHSSEIKLNDNVSLPMNNLTLQKKLNKLNEGESITIGSVEGNADVLIGSAKSGVSEEHLQIKKVNNEFIVEELNKSNNSTEVAKTAVKASETKEKSKPLSPATLHLKIQEQLAITTPEEIKTAVNEVMKNVPGATEEEVVKVMQKMSQFGNYHSLTDMAEQLNHMGVNGFYSYLPGMTLNSTLSYIGERKLNFRLDAQGDYKAYIIDDSGLNYLENLKKKNNHKFNQLINDKNVEFVNLDGWDSGVNIYNANPNLAEKATKILTKAKEIKASNTSLSFDEAVSLAQNKQNLDRAERLGIKFPTTISNKTALKEPASVNQVVKQLEPLNISKEKMRAIVDGVAEGMFSEYPEKLPKAKKLLMQYFDAQTKVYSPKSMAIELKDMHTMITKSVENSGKSLDNVYYVIPKQGKSFEQVALQYAEVNNIDKNKFVYYSGLNTLSSNIPKDATFVLLDDVVGTGQSMCEQEFVYDHAIKTFEKNNQNIIFAPVMGSSRGLEFIQKNINSNKRANIDKIVIDAHQIKQPLREMDFYKKLSHPDQAMLNNMVGALDEYNREALSAVFPYMGPDNNAPVSSALTQYFVLSRASLKIGPTNHLSEFVKFKILHNVEQYEKVAH